MKINLVSYIKIKDPTNKLVLRSFPIPSILEDDLNQDYTYLDNEKGRSLKKGRFIAIYGNKSIQKVLSDVRRMAMEDGSEIYRVNIIIDGVDQPTGRIGINDLSNLWFLNIERIKDDLSQKIINSLSSINNIHEFKNARQLFSVYPNLLDFLWNDPDFKHIKVFVWNAPLTKNMSQSIKLAAVRDESCFSNIDIQGIQSIGGEEIVLAVS